MQPTINREAILIDRRQPILRWTAVLAGAVCSIGFWIVLQFLGVGIGLASVDTTDSSSLHSAGIGTTTWSLLTPLIATFLGGLLAGKLAQTYDRKLAATHGVVMWAITSILGLSTTIWLASMIARAAADHAGLDSTRDSTSWTTDRLTMADSTGKALAIVGSSLLLSLITAAVGAMVAARPPRRSGTEGPYRGVHRTELGYSPPIEPTTSTAPYGAPVSEPAVPPLQPR
jgi:MFS family permease